MNNILDLLNDPDLKNRKEGFARLWEMYEAGLKRGLRRHRYLQEQDIEDIVQDTWKRVWQRIKSGSPPNGSQRWDGRIPGYLFKALHDTLYDYLRRGKRNDRLQYDGEAVPHALDNSVFPPRATSRPRLASNPIDDADEIERITRRVARTLREADILKSILDGTYERSKLARRHNCTPDAIDMARNRLEGKLIRQWLIDWLIRNLGLTARQMDVLRAKLDGTCDKERLARRHNCTPEDIEREWDRLLERLRADARFREWVVARGLDPGDGAENPQGDEPQEAT